LLTTSAAPKRSRAREQVGMIVRLIATDESCNPA